MASNEHLILGIWVGKSICEFKKHYHIKGEITMHIQIKSDDENIVLTIQDLDDDTIMGKYSIEKKSQSTIMEDLIIKA